MWNAVCLTCGGAKMRKTQPQFSRNLKSSRKDQTKTQRLITNMVSNYIIFLIFPDKCLFPLFLVNTTMFPISSYLAQVRPSPPPPPRHFPIASWERDQVPITLLEPLDQVIPKIFPLSLFWAFKLSSPFVCLFCLSRFKLSFLTEKVLTNKNICKYSYLYYLISSSKQFCKTYKKDPQGPEEGKTGVNTASSIM